MATAQESHGQRSLVGCSLWGREESDTTERLHFHFSLSCFGEGNGNPLQCSCLEKSQGRGSLVGCRLWGRTESDTTDATQQQQQQQQQQGGRIKLHQVQSITYIKSRKKYKLSQGDLLGVSRWPPCLIATEWALKSSELVVEFLIHHLPAGHPVCLTYTLSTS